MVFGFPKPSLKDTSSAHTGSNFYPAEAPSANFHRVLFDVPISFLSRLHLGQSSHTVKTAARTTLHRNYKLFPGLSSGRGVISFVLRPTWNKFLRSTMNYLIWEYYFPAYIRSGTCKCISQLCNDDTWGPLCRFSNGRRPHLRCRSISISILRGEESLSVAASLSVSTLISPYNNCVKFVRYTRWRAPFLFMGRNSNPTGFETRPWNIHFITGINWLIHHCCLLHFFKSHHLKTPCV